MDLNSRMQRLSREWDQQDGRRFNLAIVIIAAINVAAATSMILNIIYDARKSAQWRLSLKSLRKFYFSLTIHSAEVFPLIISAAIVVQGVVFIVVQSRVKSVLMRDCAVTSQIIWPALWIVPYTMLIFGLETMFRSLHRKRFQRQRKWHLLACLGLIVLITIVTWIPSHVSPRTGQCLASIIWWTPRYSKVALAIGCGLMFTFVVCAGVITMQLLKTVKLERHERIAATRMVYYLLVSTFILALVIPYYAQTLMLIDGLTTSQIAEVALNTQGIINLILHIFLRSNADRTAIRPVEAVWLRKRRLRIFGPNDLDTTMHITSPVPHDSGNEKHWDDRKGLLRNRQEQIPYRTRAPLPINMGPGYQDAPKVHTSTNGMNRPETRIFPQSTLSRFQSQRPSRYSLFPTHASAGLRTSMSTTFSDGDDADLPQIPLPLFSPTHRRDTSDQTSATVEIGMRVSYFSHALEPIPSASLRGPNPPSLRSPTYGSQEPRSKGPSGIRDPSLTDRSISSEDIIVLPLQNMSPQSDRFGHNVERTTSVRVPGWLTRQASRSRSQRIGLRRLTMKALPPDPPREGGIGRSEDVRRRSPSAARRPSDETWV